MVVVAVLGGADVSMMLGFWGGKERTCPHLLGPAESEGDNVGLNRICWTLKVVEVLVLVLVRRS